METSGLIILFFHVLFLQPARHTKLEKADILEMTVKHLQSVQRQQLNMAIQSDPTVVHKFKTGFVECAEEVNRYVSQMEGIDSGVRQRLSAHLNNCANSLEQIGSMSQFNSGCRGQLPTAAMFPGAAATAAAAPLFPPLPQDLNNNNNNSRDGVAAAAPAIQMGGLQLIPSRLPSGEFALIMPNSTTTTTATTAAAVAPAPFVWPGATASAALANIANPTHLNDYAQSFRMSAFNKPTAQSGQTQLQGGGGGAGGLVATVPTVGHKQTTSSPPLSPISSISSHSQGDESRAASPASAVHADLLLAKQHSFAGVFSTPPPTSAETSFNTSGSLNLSAGSHDSSASAASHSLVSHLQQQQVSSTSGQESAAAKREREQEQEQADSSDSSIIDEPLSKKYLAAASEKSASAWRPW